MKKLLISLFCLMALPLMAGHLTIICAVNPEPDIVSYQFYEVVGSSTNLVGASATNGIPVTGVANGPHVYCATAVNSWGIVSDFSTNLTVIYPQAPGNLKGAK